MFIIVIGVSQQYNIYSKTAIFFEKVEKLIVLRDSHRASDLVQCNLNPLKR